MTTASADTCTDGHNFDLNVTAYVKVDEDYHQITCADCGYTSTLAHDWWEWSGVNADEHWRKCWNCHATQIADHTWSSWSDLGDGTHQHTCTGCGYSPTESHTWGDWESNGGGLHVRYCQAASCTAQETELHQNTDFVYNGPVLNSYQHVHTCTVCGQQNFQWCTMSGWVSTGSTQHKMTCSTCGGGPVENHTWGDWTSGGASMHYRLCTVCGSRDRAQHTFGDWAKGDDNGHQKTCSVCGHVTTESHVWSKWYQAKYTKGSHWHDCDICMYAQTLPHEGGTATCTEQAVCNICALPYGDLKPHTPGTPVTTAATCTTDGSIVTSYAQATAPTCTTNGTYNIVCNDCNAVLKTAAIEAAGHQNPYTTNTDATCTTEGKNETYCGVCHELLNSTVIAKKGHDLDSGVTTPATCTAEGKTVYTCQRNGCSYTESTVLPMVDHAEGEPVIDPAATCCNTGLKSWYCVNCSKLLRTETIAALGHDAEGTYQWVTATEPTCTEEGVEKKVCAHSSTELGETRAIPALGHHYVGLWQVGESDSHYRDCHRCGAGRMNVDCDYLPLEIDNVMYQVCPVCGRFHDQKLEAVDNSNVVLATGSEPGSFLVRMLAQPFGADEVRYPVIMTAIFEAGGRIADPAENVTTMQIEVPTDFSAGFTLVFVSVDEATSELVWTEVPCTLENGKLTFTVEELGLFLFVAK